MAKKTVGYVELEWTCEQCGTRNPGSSKTCKGCGAAMGEHQQFDQAAQEEFIVDQEKLEAAKAGPDIHCPYCGTRNPAGSTACSRCGGNLVDGRARESGKVMGQHRDQAAPDVACPHCGTMNLATAVKCKNCGGTLQQAPAQAPAPAKKPAPKRKFPIGLLAIVAILCLAAVIVGVMLTSRTSDTVGVVQSVRWERTIPVMGMAPAEHDAWEDEVPAEATLGVCKEKLRRTESEPVPGAREVCGTPYTVDKGSGFGEVVTDCEYEIYDPWCSYTVMEWAVVNTLVAQGMDRNPYWPEVMLAQGQEAGDRRSETYVVNLREDDGNKTWQYKPRSPAEFAQFTDGSFWNLKVNALGGVMEVEPAQ